jgi:predicted nuclease of predicted toxin-antitoxin system
MKILLDHCIDWRLRRSLSDHEVKSTKEMGWENLKNGKLLAAAAAAFDLFLTVDQNIKTQQNLSALPIPVIVLVAASNRRTDLLPLLPLLEGALQKLKPGQLIEIRISGMTICGANNAI